MVFPFTGTPIELATEYIERVLRPQADRLEVSERVQPVRVGSHLGVRVAYIGLFRGCSSSSRGWSPR